MVGQESLKSSLMEFFIHSGQDIADRSMDGLKRSFREFMSKMNIVICLNDAHTGDCYDDLQTYHSRLVSSHLMNEVHKLFSKAGDGFGLRSVFRTSCPYFLSLGGSKSKYAKYCFKDNVCYDASSERQKTRSDLCTTINAWGGPHSVDSDEFQEHRIKNLKGLIDSLHGNLDPLSLEQAVKAADVQIKFAAEFERDMETSSGDPDSSHKLFTLEERNKVAKMIQDLRPFSFSRRRVHFVAPLLESNNFSNLVKNSNIVSDFLHRNKKQFAYWGPFL